MGSYLLHLSRETRGYFFVTKIYKSVCFYCYLYKNKNSRANKSFHCCAASVIEEVKANPSNVSLILTPENKNNTHLKMKLLFIGTALLLASAVHADQKKEEHKAKVVSSKPTPVSNPAKAPQLSRIPKSHSFVRHSRKLSKPLRPRLKPSLENKLFGKYAAPRQWRSKAPLRKAPLRKRPRKLPNFKSRQATPVRLPAFQNRPIQPIPSLRPVQVVPAVERNPRFRRLVSNLRQSASSLRHGIERGNSNLRQSL